MKKKILFVMNNLNCGGAEKALISLLETFDYSRYEVDLFLFKHEGLFFNKIPKEINLLPEPQEYQLFDMSIKKAIYTCIRDGKILLAANRFSAGLIFRTEKNKARCEQRVWKYLSKCLVKLNKNYDVAIGYLEKNPIYFCLEKVKAKKKIGFIHNDYDKLGMDANLDLKFFKRLDNIVTVSLQCANVLKHRFPMYEQKISVMHNIISPGIINKMACEFNPFNKEGIKIVTVGRLNEQKGFDLAIEACKKVIQDGYKIKWYAIGEGEDRELLEKLIKDNNLDNDFMLAGIKENPYPYVRGADLYVQPSRFEGKSIAVDEAKILGKPILLTNFSTAKDQIIDGEDGIIVDINSEALANGIKRLINNKDLSMKLTKCLSNTDLGTESEIQKLYKLIEAG